MPAARSKPGGWLLVCTALLLAACTSPADPPSATDASAQPTTTVGAARAEQDVQLTRHPPRDYRLASSSLSSIGGRPVETNGGHWTVAAARGRASQRLLALSLRPPNATRPSTCRLTKLEGEPVTACLVPPYERGGGYYGGHIAYAWRHKDVVYHITIHGYANEPRASLMMAALIARETDP